jgi:hypothetical protein
MAARAAPFDYVSVEEFLAEEQTSTVRHEYVGGVLHALAGGTDWHNEIVAGSGVIPILCPDITLTPDDICVDIGWSDD